MKQIITLLICFTTLSMFAQSKDWANMSFYDNANDSVKILDQEHRQVVFMGNSITFNWNKLDRQFFKDNGYIGRGISGQTSSQMLVRFRQDVINLHPKIVVVNAGTNDIAENGGIYREDITYDNIVSMAELAKANDIQPVLTSVLPVKDYYWNRSVTDIDAKIVSLNNRLKKYAEDNNIPFLDYYAFTNDGEGKIIESYARDGVHPNMQGYRLMEQKIKFLLDDLLSK